MERDQVMMALRNGRMRDGAVDAGWEETGGSLCLVKEEALEPSFSGWIIAQWRNQFHVFSRACVEVGVLEEPQKVCWCE